MSHDVASDGLLGVGREHGRSVYLGHHLVSDDDRDAELVGQPEQHAQEAGQVHLARRELAAPAVVGPVQRGGAVADQQSVPGGRGGGGAAEGGYWREEVNQ